MAEYELIDAYVNELRLSTAKVHDRDAVAEEVTDHLTEAVEWLVRDGHSIADAQHEALARFGSAALVSRAFVQDRKRGAAVPTVMTRRAGFAAMLAPPLLVAGIWMIRNWHYGVGYASNVACTGAGVLFALFGLWGLRRRCGGLGSVGRFAFWLAIFSPVLAAPAGWGAPAALALILTFDLALLGVGLWRAGVLPRLPIVLFAGGPVWMLAIAGTMAATNRHSGRYFWAGLVPLVVGFVWLGVFMARERPAGGAHTPPAASAA